MQVRGPVGCARGICSSHVRASPPCSIWIGLGDQGNNELKIIGYSNQLVNIYVGASEWRRTELLSACVCPATALPCVCPAIALPCAE